MNIYEWIADAIEAIRNGTCNKMTRDNVMVYRVKNIIRIDIKEENNNGN